MADVSDTALPLEWGSRFGQQPGATSFRRSKQVEPDLRDAALAEASKPTHSPKRKHLQPSDVDRLATRVLDVGRGEEDQKDFVERLGLLLRESGETRPSPCWHTLCCRQFYA